MATIFQERTNNSSLNFKTQKNDIITEHYNTKNDNSSKNDSSLKKLYLPTIQKKSVQTMPVSSLTKRLKKSQSQSYLIKDNQVPSSLRLNSEKEKILLAKYSLARIKVKINDLFLSNKKLIAEKEANLNIIKSAIVSDDPTYTDDILLKIEQFLEESMRNYNNKRTITSVNYENLKSTEDKMSKIEESKEKMNKTLTKEENENFNIKDHTMKNKEEKKEENNNNPNQNGDNKNKDIDENSKNQNENYEQKNIEQNKINNDQKNNIEGNNNNNEESKNNEANNNSNENKDKNQENQQRHNYSIETRSEDVNKVNSFINNSHLMNNNTSFNNININNSLEEQINCIKEIIEEKEEDKNQKEPEKVVHIESGIFEKSSVPRRIFDILKAKSELSVLKHKLINIQQKIRTKDEEIEELKSRAKFKNIIFQKNVLDSKMITLHRIKTKNKEMEEISLPTKNLLNENLKKELKYYNEINKTYIEGNKGAEEDYLKKKSEFEEKSRSFTYLEAKNNNLKYKYNSLRLNDLKKKSDLENLKLKINQIDDIKQVIENDKQMIEEKKKEIEEIKKNLDKKIDEYNKNRENKENKYQEMNKYQREINNKINKQKNDFNRIKKEIKEIDKLIYQEVEKYHNLNIKDKDLVNQMLLSKNKTSAEFIDYLQELEKIENKKFEDSKKGRFKKLNIGQKINHIIISKIKRKPSKKGEEKKSSENLPLLEEKLEYFLNNKGEKDVKKEEEKDKKQEENKVDKNAKEKGKK